MSLNLLFLCGKKQFLTASVYCETMNITDDKASTNEALVLREELHQQKDVRYTILGHHCMVTNDFITSSSTLRAQKSRGLDNQNKSESSARNINALKCIAFGMAWMICKENLPALGQS